MNRKPLVLVVTYDIPKPDKSSGDLRFFSVLQMLSDFWSLHFCIVPSHVEWNRSDELTPYIRSLETESIHVLPVTEDSFQTALTLYKYDGAYFNLFWVAEEVLSDFRKKFHLAFIVVDSVDVHFAREESQAKLGEKTIDEVLATKKRELEVYKSADVTIAVSQDDYLLLSGVDKLRKIFLIPNIVRQVSRMEGIRPPLVIFIGCYAWSPNPDAVKWFVSDIWPDILKARPDAEFYIIGSQPTKEILSIDVVQGVTVIGYVPDTAPYYSKAAVAIAPLRFGGGMKGKVNEAMAHGVPVVSTSIGAQGFQVINYKHMIIADDPEGFANGVLKLLNDADYQQRMGLAGQLLNGETCAPEVVRLQIAELVDYCKKISLKKKLLNPYTWSGFYRLKWNRIKTDFGFGIDLLKREGFSEFLHRSFLYLQGVRLPIRPLEVCPKGEYKLIKPTDILQFEQIEAPKVSIIIPVHNQWAYTHSCLASIQLNTTGVSYEVIVIDDCSVDETIHAEKYVQGTLIIRNETNLGFLESCNKAALHANGDYLVFLNNDTLVQPEWLDWMVRTMETNPLAGMVGAKLIFSNGSLQEAGGIVFNDASAMNYGREDDPGWHEYNYLREVDYCSGAGICVRKELWNRLGGFDVRFSPAYYEDTDLAMQIRQAGFKVIFQPRSVIVHFEGISHGTDIKTGIKRKQEENRRIFFDKWVEVLTKHHAPRKKDLFNARERWPDTPTVLVIVRRVPNPGLFNSDHKTIQLVKDLVQRRYRVKMLPDDSFRWEPATGIISQYGVEVVYNHIGSDTVFAWLEKNAGYFDQVWIAGRRLGGKYSKRLKRITRNNQEITIY